ncbi:RNA polymerase factor sigma-32 [Buchnera aphidicola]|uniref:RNA polymerase factor sigma-32 n=1 Tax=Buchnera aphidicola TaxID=9 RepID=UPI002237DB8A|nr:RNA polymerase factor sigma-32 [Buchnera aphidicola (Stegophylla sp.)]
MIKKIQYLYEKSCSNLKIYIFTVKMLKILSSSEEHYLTEKLYYYGNLISAKTIILSNLRLIIHITKNYLGYGMTHSDLIQSGNFGLIKSIFRFNPNINIRFISFALYWIKSEIHEYILRNWRIVKIATTKSQRKIFFNLKKNKNTLKWLDKNEIKVFTQILGVHTQDIKEMESRILSQDITIHPFIELKKKKKNIINNLVPYLNNLKYDISYVIKLNTNKNINSKYKLNHTILTLDTRSRNIINARWIIDQEKKITLKKIANNYGISAERVRQIESNAIKKMK